MPKRGGVWWVVASVLGSLLFEAPVWANAAWSVAIGDTGAPTAPATDFSFNPTKPSVYIAQNTKLYSYNATANTTAGGGTARWTAPRDFTPTVLSNFPEPVPLKGGQNVIFFVGGTTGGVFAINAADGTNFWGPSTPSISPPASVCTGADPITAAPTIQLWNFSDSAFKKAFNDDLIFVSTHYSCTNAANANKVYAYYASTGALAWTFNGGGSYSVGIGSESCSLDYTADRIYCGFDQNGNTYQTSLYAISTLDGSKAWAANAGNIHTRPTLRNNKIYVTTTDGYLRARSTADGSETWSTHVSSYALKNPFAEPRQQTPYKNMLVVVDLNGGLYAYDDTVSTSMLWGNAGYGAMSTVATAPYDSRLYVGKNDGTIHELGYESGVEKASYTFGGSTGQVYDPSLANEGSTNQDGNRLFTVSGGVTGKYTGQLAVFAIPFVPYTGCIDAGTTLTCDGVSGEAPGSVGGGPTGLTADVHCGGLGSNCFSDACTTRTCVSDGDMGTVCQVTPTCTQECCPASGNNLTCSNTQTDPTNCGGCGIDCPAGNSCVAGVCTPSCPTCTGATPHCNSNNQCICDYTTNSCTALGSNGVCDPVGGSCSCTPYCDQCEPAGSSNPNGCNGTCAPTCSAGQNPGCWYTTINNNYTEACGCTASPNSCASLGTNGTCQINQGVFPPYCSCATSCPACVAYGAVVGNGCNGTCAQTCSKTAPNCNGTACACTATSCASLGTQYSCVSGSCVCKPYCPTSLDDCHKNTIADGCGGTCPSNCTTGICCPGGGCGTVKSCESGLGN